MKKVMTMLVVFVMMVMATNAFAVRSVTKDGTGVVVQGGATNPLTITNILTNASATVALYPDILWFSVFNGGNGTCQIRIMNNTTKASWPQIPVPPLTSFSRVVHRNALYLNYSGCAGVTGSNSILERM